MKPSKPYTRKEIYLDRATGGEGAIPEPITNREHYYAKIAGASVSLPEPVIIYDRFLAKIAGMDVEVPTYNACMPHIYLFLAKAAGQDVEIPMPITREEMYWYDYINAAPQPTEKEYTGAVPVTITADGTPLIDYLITGNTTQSGTPTPDSPIMPQGTGKRTGNLWDEETLEGYYNSSGSYTYVTGQLCTKNKIPVTPNTQYWLGVPATDPKAFLSVSTYNSQGAFVERFALPSYSGAGVQYTTNANTYYINVNFSTYYGGTYKNNVMICEGSTVMPYEPYGYKIPISSANTTTPVYLGEVQTTRQIKKLVLTGEEDWTQSGTASNAFYCSVTGYLRQRINITICSHYTSQANINGAAEMQDGNVSFYANAAQPWEYFYVRDSNLATVADLKSYLAAQYAAGTPVTIWYVLATETTGIVNEPLMRIGDYADTLSKTQAGVEIPTNNGSTTVDVDTTVKPSEVYIKYMGV